ncbi:hypothetical protein B0F90DRAFT_1813161 [Multifurca ochricompacta]|uniref:Uncharacterized protein n=1 Tax=Multifurca ochricompacta TaxID=376703 RepID=A0AAD4QTH2_9AGAM|nr:hypothetical protein B0F90DRAFT_1813161 [Multifurca ochricompacta]
MPPQESVERGFYHTGRTLEPSKTESYLLSLIKDRATPTLRELERLKPSEFSDPRSEEYALEYSNLLDNICRSFSINQLRTFSQQYGLHLSSKRRKMSYAEAIVEKAWQWPSLRELRRAQRDRIQITSQTLALTPSELFILLGKDGSDLFQMSRKHNVYVSVKPKPLAVYLEGTRESVREAENYIDSGIVEETFNAPSKNVLSQEVLQRISRTAGAFVENVEDYKFRARAKHPTNNMLAKRLATRMTYQAEPSELLVQQMHHEELRTPTAAPLAYSLFPFSVPRSTPMMSSNTFFRWRRVGDWLGDTRLPSVDIGNLAYSQGCIFSVDGTEIDLQHRLLRKSLTPTTKNGSRRLISAFLPVELVKALPSQQRVLHRLVYRCLPILKENSEASVATKFIRLEIPLVDPKQVRYPVGLPDGGIFMSTMVWSGCSTNVDLFMPDRYMDLRFNISDVSPLTSDEHPGELVGYLKALENFLTSSDSNVAQPAPPLFVSYGDHEYVLVTNASVRQSAESLSLGPSPGTAVTSESILDLEGAHHSAVCVVSSKSNDLGSPLEWNAFLQKCDWMTARPGPRYSKLL